MYNQDENPSDPGLKDAVRDLTGTLNRFNVGSAIFKKLMKRANRDRLNQEKVAKKKTKNRAKRKVARASKQRNRK